MIAIVPLVAFIVLFPMAVLAVPVPDTVGTPLFREDGSALKVSEIANITSYCGAAVGDYSYPVINVATVITLPKTNLTLELPVGISYCVHVATDKGKRSSTYSGVTKYNVLAAPVKKSNPQAPTVSSGKLVRYQIPAVR